MSEDDLERGQRVQIWDMSYSKPVLLGVGTVIEIARPMTNPKKRTVFVYSHSLRRVFYGDRYDFVPEKSEKGASK